MEGLLDGVRYLALLLGLTLRLLALLALQVRPRLPSLASRAASSAWDPPVHGQKKKNEKVAILN